LDPYKLDFLKENQMLKIISVATALILSVPAFADSYNCSFQLKGTTEDGEVIGKWQESDFSLDLNKENFTFILWKKAVKNEKNEIIDYVLNPTIYNGNTKHSVDVEYPIGSKQLKISISGPNNFSAVGKCSLEEVP